MTAVTLIALPGALGSTLTIPLEMLSAARDIARSRRDPTAELSLTIASDGHRSVELMGGMRLECESSLPDLTSMPASHIVFIPGFWGNPRAMLLRNAGVVSWLASQQPAIVCAITTGSYFTGAFSMILQNATPASTSREIGLLPDRPIVTAPAAWMQYATLCCI